MSQSQIVCSLVVGTLALGVASCTSNETDGSGGSGVTVSTGDGATTTKTNATATGAQTTGTGNPNLNWTTLMSEDWSLAPGSEDPSDNRQKTMDRTIYVGAIRPIAPAGTHHTLLGIGNVTSGVIYASGVGSDAVVFPEGVGLKLEQGDNLILQLHLFNPSGMPLSGTSGIEIVEVPADQVVHEADLLLAGPMNLSIPPNQQSTQSANCSIGSTQTIFAIFPHMHQLGTHFKTTLTVAGQTQVLHDGEYQFSHQPFIPFQPITLQAGDKVTTECTWNNTTSSNVQWGESSTTEMCYSILYRYPAQNGFALCPF